jgi:O-acetyl-ADP-ribose deacetylase (regulator of RNase III)
VTVIRELSGDLLASKARVLVNPVNCLGVSGAGLANAFAAKFPGNQAAYRKAARLGGVRLGRVLWFWHYDQDEYPRGVWIANFPTKGDWKAASQVEWIVAGLDDLRREIEDRELSSVAVPALGCGLGGLAWEQVRSVLYAAFDGMPFLEVEIYRPIPEPKG